MTIQEIKNKLGSLFKEKELQLVILFGSTASGRNRKGSDIDVAFLFDEPVDILMLTNRVLTLLHDDEVDVVDLRRASPLLKLQVAKTGHLLYERSSGLFNAFYSLAFRMYADSQKLRVAQHRMIREYLRDG